MAKYSKKLVKQIADLVKSDSYTIKEICSMVGINKDTYYDWLNKKSEFSDTIKEAEETRMKIFVEEAKYSLKKKIQGYTVKEKKIITEDSGEKDIDGKPIPKIKQQIITDKHFQPDITAIIFTLTNLEPENWKNRQNTDITTGGESFLSFVKKANQIKKGNKNQ